MNIIDRIKNWFKERSSKQQLIEEPKNLENKKRLEEIKVKPLSELSNEELNEIMQDMELNPWDSQTYSDEQLLEEILKRLGADEELVKRCANSKRVNKIYKYHRLGRLVSTEKGRTIYVDEYSNGKTTYTTTIQYEDGVIELSNPQYYDYYADRLIGRVTNNIKISKNDFGGVTLENKELGNATKREFISIIEYDGNDIEMKVIKDFGLAYSIVQRNIENPFLLNETLVYREELERKRSLKEEGVVDLRYPDQLYSLEDLDRITITQEDYSNKKWDIDIKELKQKNPKAAKFLAEYLDGKGNHEVGDN